MNAAAKASAGTSANTAPVGVGGTLPEPSMAFRETGHCAGHRMVDAVETVADPTDIPLRKRI